MRQAHLSFSTVNETIVSQHQFFKNVVAYELAFAHSDDCPARAFEKLDLRTRSEFAPLAHNVQMAGCIILMDAKVPLDKMDSVGTGSSYKEESHAVDLSGGVVRWDRADLVG